MAEDNALAAFAASQHGPRPLPLFLEMLRSETAAKPALRERALRGLVAYQAAPREPRTQDRPIIAMAGRATLRDHGGSGRTVVIVPSLINPPSIVDLMPGRSLADFLAERHRVFVVDWGVPTGEDAALGLSVHIERLLLPLLDAVKGEATLVGYCLGGTLALAAACIRRVRAVVTVAAPWQFAGYDDAARTAMVGLWQASEPACRAMGIVPMEVLQAAFWQLDPARTVAKFADFAELASDSEAARLFVRLEDWANGGAPLPYAAGRDLFETLLGDDAPGRGAWCVGGQRADLSALTCPVAEFVATDDRIVPAATAAGVGTRHLVDAGHVGMMVGSRARPLLWEPLASWLAALPA